MFDLSQILGNLFGGGQQGPMQLGQLGQQSAGMQSPPLGMAGSPIGNITGMFAGQRPQGGLGEVLWDFMKKGTGQAAGNPQADQALTPPGFPSPSFQPMQKPHPLAGVMPQQKPQAPQRMAQAPRYMGQRPPLGINQLPGTRIPGEDGR